MKAKTFENLIRKIVREEIDYALRREIKSLKEDLREELKPTITEHTEKLVEVPNTPISETVKISLKEKIMGKAPLKQNPNKNYVANSTLNELLNETAQGDTNTQTGNAPVHLSEPFATNVSTCSPGETTGVPEPVAKAITRDYSGLMKAIKDKKGK